MIPRDQYGAEHKKPQDNRIYGSSEIRKGLPTRSIAPSFFSPSKTPCNTPPWGTTEAVDLFTGKPVWDVPLGTLVPGRQTGSINLGGPMITAGGLVFTSAGMDLYLHAFDIETAKRFGSISCRRVARLLR